MKSSTNKKEGATILSDLNITSHRAFYDPLYPPIEELGTEARKQVERLNREIHSGEMLLEEVSCLCGAWEFALLAKYDRYRIQNRTVICRSCGLIQSNPRMTSEVARTFYTSDAYRWLYDEAQMVIDRRQFDSMVKRSRYRFDFVIGQLGEVPSSVLEVGCGGGWNLWPYRQTGARVVGCDYGPTLVDYGRSLGIDLRQGGIDEVGEERFDFIVLSHMLEHLLDPVTELARIAKNLAAGGSIYVEVPNADHFCIGGLQNAHIYYFSPRTLSAFMGKAGIKIVAGKLFGSHLAVIAQPSDDLKRADLSAEYATMSGQIKRHDRRERFKDVLRNVGLLGAVRTLKSVLKR